MRASCMSMSDLSLVSVMALSSVRLVPLKSRPTYNEADDELPDDIFYVLSVGPPFLYVIPTFDVLSVELRQMRIHGVTEQGESHIYDVFIRNDPSLARSYPAWITVMDAVVVDVSLHCVS